MRTVQPGIESIKLFGKDHHIPIICLGNEGYSFHLTEVLRFGQGDSHSIARVSAVGDDVFPFQPGHARVFNAELFVGGKWAVRRGSEKGLGIDGEVESVATAGQTKDRAAGAQMRTEKHDEFVLMFNHSW